MSRWLRGAHVAALALGAAIVTPSVARPDQCIACQADPAAGRSEYSEEQWAALQRGQIVSSHYNASTSTESANQMIEASAIVPRAPALVWSVITDFDCRPKFMANVKSVRVVRAEGSQVWISEELRVWGMKIDYNVIGTLDAPHGVFSWVLDKSKENDIAESVGAWQVFPLDDGQSTLTQYRAHLDTGRPVPGFIESFLTRRSLPEIVERLRDEVLRRYPVVQSEIREHMAR